MRNDVETGSSQEAETEIITRSLSLSKLRDMRKDFSHHPGEHIVTWLLRCWDNGTSSLELEGKEAKQLGSLARDKGIDKAIGKKEPVLSPRHAQVPHCSVDHHHFSCLQISFL